MGSVLIHGIPPYEIWAGNPAHFICKRFDDETIEQLLQLKWWNIVRFVINGLKRLFSDFEQLTKSIGVKVIKRIFG